MRKLLPLVLCLLGHSQIGTAQQKALDQADSVLERLEQKLLEQEGSTLQILPPGPVKNRVEKNQPLQFPTKSISGKLPEEDKFNQIDKQLANLEGSVEELSGRIEKIKSDVLTKSDKANLIEIVAELVAPRETNVRDLEFSLDNRTVYQIMPEKSPWNPRPQIALYVGPLEPGEHTIQIKGKLLRKFSDSLPVDQNQFHIYDQTLKIDVPSGFFRKGFRLKIARPEQQNTHAQAMLETYEIN